MSALDIILSALVGGLITFVMLRYELAKNEDEKNKDRLYIPLYKEVQENLKALSSSSVLESTTWNKLDNDGLTVLIKRNLREKISEFYSESNKYNDYIKNIDKPMSDWLLNQIDGEKEGDLELKIRTNLLSILKGIEAKLKNKIESSSRLGNLLQVLDKHNWVVNILVIIIIAFITSQLTSQQNELTVIQNNISLKQADINEKLYNLTKSREPHPVLFVEPSSDYGLAFADNEIAAFPSLTKTLSTDVNETFTLTLVNPGSGPLNIKGVWSMYICRNWNTNKTFNGFPELYGHDSRKISLKERQIAKIFDNTILMPNEKISERIIVRPPKFFNNEANNYTGIEEYTCNLNLDIFSSYENNDFNETKGNIPFQWSNLPAKELSLKYPEYQAP